MSNFILFVLIHIVCYSLLLAFYKLFGKDGIFAWIGIASIMGNVACNLVYYLVGTLEQGGGCACMASVFLATDLLAELYDKKTARKGALISTICILAYMLLSQLVIRFTPAEVDFGMEHFRAVLQFSPRFSIMSVTAVCLSGLLDIKLFSKLKDRHGEKKLWLRNNLCTITSQLIDNAVFMLAYIGLLPANTIVKMIFVGTAVEVFSALFDTPFVYIGKYKIGVNNG